MTAADILDKITMLALETTDSHRVIVIGPAGVLTDSLAGRDDRLARDAILRTDRLRTIVRLPQGLLTPRPRERLALMCFGSATTVSGSRDRTILTADLSNVSLDAAAIDDMVTDIVAGLGGPGGGGRRHPRFLRPVLVRRLLTRTGDLLDAGTMPGLPTANGPDLVLRITEIAQIVGTPDHIDHAFQVVANTPGDQRPSETTVGSAVERGEIKLIPGHRLDHGDLSSGGSVPVLGVEEIVGTFATGQRRVDRLEFASRYPSGRSTEPGDVVFCTAPRPRAIVDDAGGSVVALPSPGGPNHGFTCLRHYPTDAGCRHQRVACVSEIVAELGHSPGTARSSVSSGLRLDRHPCPPAGSHAPAAGARPAGRARRDRRRGGGNHHFSTDQ